MNDRREVEAGLDDLCETLTRLVRNAAQLALTRCPYRNRFNHCTAAFDCPNQASRGVPVTCASDGFLGHRKAGF